MNVNRLNISLAVEFGGTFLLTGAVLMGTNPFVALGLLVLLFGNTASVHLNPAVSAGMGLIGKLKADSMYMFWLMQVAGAIAARAFYTILTPVDSTFSVLATPTTIQNFLAEVVGAAVLLFGIRVAVDQKLSGINFAVACGGAYFLGSIFGGILNPAIALGTNNLSFAAIAGPLIGGAAGAWFADKVRAAR